MNLGSGVKTLAVAAGLVACAGQGASADLLAEESFEYAPGTLAGANGGTGWSTGWKSNAALTTDSSAAVLADSIAPPPNYVEAPTGGSAKQVAMLAYRGLATGAQIDLGVDQDYYISYLATRTDEGRVRSITLQLQAGSATVLNTGAGTSGEAYTTGFGDLVETETATVGVGAPVLMVIKIAARSAEPDQSFVQTYSSLQSGDLPTAEPTTWLVTGNTADRDDVLTQVLFATGGGGGLQIDEIRIGTSWADVVAVPEPASAMLLVTGAVTMLSRRTPSAR